MATAQALPTPIAEQKTDSLDTEDVSLKSQTETGEGAKIDESVNSNDSDIVMLDGGDVRGTMIDGPSGNDLGESDARVYSFICLDGYDAHLWFIKEHATRTTAYQAPSSVLQRARVALLDTTYDSDDENDTTRAVSDTPTSRPTPGHEHKLKIDISSHGAMNEHDATRKSTAKGELKAKKHLSVQQEVDEEDNDREDVPMAETQSAGNQGVIDELGDTSDSSSDPEESKIGT